MRFSLRTHFHTFPRPTVLRALLCAALLAAGCTESTPCTMLRTSCGSSANSVDCMAQVDRIGSGGDSAVLCSAELGNCGALARRCAGLGAGEQRECTARLQAIRDMRSPQSDILCAIELGAAGAAHPVMGCENLVACCQSLATTDARTRCAQDVVLAQSLADSATACDRAFAQYQSLGVCGTVTTAEECDTSDPTACLLPFPSDVYTRNDSTTRTGRRVNLNFRSLNARDDISRANLADGFSRISPIVTGFRGSVAVSSVTAGTTPQMVLYAAEGPTAGMQIPLRFSTQKDAVRGVSVLTGYPLQPLEPRTAYVAVVRDGIRQENGSAIAQDHNVRVALALDAPTSTSETALAARYQSVRAFLTSQNIDAAHVLRAWTFHTRSQEDAEGIMNAMRAHALEALGQGQVHVEIDSVQQRPSGAVQTIVLGRLVGVPEYRDNDYAITLNDQNLPINPTAGVMPFRVMIPRASETCTTYKMAIYGHGAGGNHTDDDFDDKFANLCFGKLSIAFYGWTNDCPPGIPMARCRTMPETALGLASLLQGAHRAAGGLLDAVNHIFVMNRALPTIVDAALSAETLGGMPNPHNGRHLDFSTHFYLGGSLGGTMGLVVGKIDDQINRAVLNVPGAGWSHWVTESYLYTLFSGTIIDSNGGTPINVPGLLSAGQILFDPIDGMTYPGNPAEDIFLVQESLGDEVMPNEATSNVVRSVGAVQVGGVLREVPNISRVTEAVGQSGYTQYAVTASIYAKHGFAIQDDAAANAAFEQMRVYVESMWSGTPRIIVPSGCRNGLCDFR